MQKKLAFLFINTILKKHSYLTNKAPKTKNMHFYFKNPKNTHFYQKHLESMYFCPETPK